MKPYDEEVEYGATPRPKVGLTFSTGEVQVAETWDGRWKFRFVHNSAIHSDGEDYQTKRQAVAAGRHYQLRTTHVEVWEKT